jgi:hypothetical protein
VVKKLAWLLAGLTVLCLAAGVLAVALSPQGDVPLEIGRALLTLVGVSVVAGLVSVLVRQVDDRRAERGAWEALLRDVIEANSKVEVARLLLRADRTASTYRDQFVELARVRAFLRGVTVGQAVEDQERFKNAVKEMRRYLDALGTEYEKNYQKVALQQRVDEQLQTKLPADLAAGQAVEAALHRPPGWLSVGQMLEDAERFPLLTAFLEDNRFKKSQFRTNYKDAKHFLQDRAGISRVASDTEQNEEEETADEEKADPPTELGTAVQTSHGIP